MIQWSERYATGIAQVDEQHRMLFRITNDFRLALEANTFANTYGLFLDLLNTYCTGHFGYEEHCMNRHHCPAAKDNKEAHRRFIETVHDYRTRFLHQGYVHATALELADFLETWLDRHIIQVDLTLRTCSADPQPES